MANLSQILIQTGIKSIKIYLIVKSAFMVLHQAQVQEILEELVMSDISKKIPEYKGEYKTIRQDGAYIQVVKMII